MKTDKQLTAALAKYTAQIDEAVLEMSTLIDELIDDRAELESKLENMTDERDALSEEVRTHERTINDLDAQVSVLESHVERR